MSENTPQPPENTEQTSRYETDEHADKRFRGWRLIGFIMGVVVVLAVVAFLVDWAVIGPLEGRVF
jgi:anti-sigma-K factor RskA